MGLLTEADESKLLIKQVIQATLADNSSFEVQEIVDRLRSISIQPPEETLTEQLSKFCEIFDLGGWFYESMILNDVGIIDELNGIIVRKREDEREANAEYRLQEADRQRNGS